MRRGRGGRPAVEAGLYRLGVTATEVTARRSRRAWRLSLAGTLVSALGTGLTMPFLLVYLHGARHVPLAVAGVVVAISAVVGMAATAVGGPFGDRFGLGRMLVAGLAAQAIGTAVLALGGDVLEAAAAVAVIAAGNGIAWPALNGLIAGQVPLAEQPRAFALRFGVMNAGIGIGGLASGWIVTLDDPASFQLVYAIDATTTAIFALLVVLGMRGTPGYRPDPDRERHHASREPHERGYRAVLTDRAFTGYLLLVLGICVFGYAQLDGPWAAFATLEGHATPRVVGIAFAVNTAVIVLAQLPVVRLTRHWRRTRLLALTAALWSVSWVATGLAVLPALQGLAADVVLVVALAIFGLGETFFSPVSGAMPNVLAPPHLRGRYNALASSTFPLGNLIGPLMAGVLLGGPAPISWVVLIVIGTALAALGALRLGRILPAHAERAPVEQSAG
jgi:MFS family permease